MSLKKKERTRFFFRKECRKHTELMLMTWIVAILSLAIFTIAFMAFIGSYEYFKYIQYILLPLVFSAARYSHVKNKINDQYLK